MKDTKQLIRVLQAKLKQGESGYFSPQMDEWVADQVEVLAVNNYGPWESDSDIEMFITQAIEDVAKAVQEDLVDEITEFIDRDHKVGIVDRMRELLAPAGASLKSAIKTITTDGLSVEEAEEYKDILGDALGTEVLDRPDVTMRSQKKEILMKSLKQAVKMIQGQDVLNVLIFEDNLQKEIEDLVRRQVTEAIRQGGPQPFDAEGKNILPKIPLEGDWEEFQILVQESTDGDVSAENEKFYEDLYSELMELYIDVGAMP